MNSWLVPIQNSHCTLLFRACTDALRQQPKRLVSSSVPNYKEGEEGKLDGQSGRERGVQLWGLVMKEGEQVPGMDLDPSQ
ncbi:unnamed protein product [Nippostrongylus brasiliensis]|uniref:Uncharacterized protein n=1 Tax=Nippostrongylus brasiliensis TaxID=27835 RepID=A0A0N4XE04_NIPBR|nr:unnamed protein product [Nippostrongylus brasiliensis]